MGRLRAWLVEILDTYTYGWPGKSLVGEDGAEAAWTLALHTMPDPDVLRRGTAVISTGAHAQPRRGPSQPDAPGEWLAAHRRTPRRVARLAVIVAGLALAGSAVGAGRELLGSPAPPAVKRDLRDVDRGMPRDLRLNPDVATRVQSRPRTARSSTSRRCRAAATVPSW
jgi:hypothetical protein